MQRYYCIITSLPYIYIYNIEGPIFKVLHIGNVDKNYLILTITSIDSKIFIFNGVMALPRVTIVYSNDFHANQKKNTP